MKLKVAEQGWKYDSGGFSSAYVVVKEYSLFRYLHYKGFHWLHTLIEKFAHPLTHKIEVGPTQYIAGAPWRMPLCAWFDIHCYYLSQKGKFLYQADLPKDNPNVIPPGVPFRKNKAGG